MVRHFLSMRVEAVVFIGHFHREEIEARIAELIDAKQGLAARALDGHDVEVGSGDSVQLVVQDGVEAYLPLSGLIDIEKERQRLEKQSMKLAKEIEKLAGRLNARGFVDKAKPDVVVRARAELAELEDQASKVQASLAGLG